MASPDVLVVGENIDIRGDIVARRLGAVKIYAATSASASRTFGADTIYATIPAGGPLSSIPVGGFILYFHITAVRPASGKTAYAISSRVNGEAYHIASVTLSDAGVLTVSWTKASDASSVSVATTALTAGATAHAACVFDAASGAFTVYIDGTASGTPVTGIAATEQPKQSSATAWHLGVHYDPATAVVADTFLPGALDGVTVLSLAGMELTTGSPTLLSVLLRHSFRQWPSPQADNCLACYDFNESVSVLTDRSNHANNATVTGTPTSTSEVALGSLPVNFIGSVQFTNGRTANVVAAQGALRYQDIVPATS